jgi:tetratricopeptide (TPR) repeat protein
VAADPSLPEAARPVASEPKPTGLLGSRFVTTLVALHAAAGEERAEELRRLTEVGADALPLGIDSIIVHLGARRAFGDEAAQALRLGKKLAERGARVGVATGRTRVDLSRSSGEVVDRAAALARDTAPSQVVADATTTELARGLFELERLENGAVLVGAPLRGRGAIGTITPFVGREAELVSVLGALESCFDEKRPVVVSISGPPGIGKTRLGRELGLRIAQREEPLSMVQVRCEPYGRAQALGVAADVLRALLGLAKGASLAQAEAMIRARRLVHDDGGLLARLLANQPFPGGADPRSARDALYLSMTELVLAATNDAPCALLFEDAQWADPESVTWLDHLLGRGAGRPLFMMLMLRPQFWRDHPQRFSGREHVRIELRPMSRRATRELARSVIGRDATDGMLEQVAAQAAGSPLFAEELARLIASGKDATRAPTIEAAIQVSLDALEDTGREAVVRMSVFGMSVWEPGLAALGVREPAAVLRKLLGSEMLVQSNTSRFAGENEYVFKHALVRDVAYSSAGEELRKELHNLAARWLGSMGEDAATVAQHFDLAGNHVEAASYWETAARRALATNSLVEAVTMADRALVFADDRPTAFARAQLLDEAYSRLDGRSSERETAISAMRENVHDDASEIRTLGARARYDDARGQGVDIEQRLTEARDRAAKLDLVEEEARCTATLAQRYAFAGQLAKAEEEASHLLDLAERREVVPAAVDAWQSRAVVRQTRGELAAALEARRAAVLAARTAGLQEREAMLTVNVGFALTTIGADEEALTELLAGIAKAQAIGSTGVVRLGKMNLLGWAATFGADKRLDHALAEPRAAADEAASSAWVTRDRVTLGMLFYRGCELLRGDNVNLPRARSLLKTAVETYRQTDNRDIVPVALGFWAESERRFGDAEQARAIAGEAALLLENGAPSLLNEAPVFLALHDACVDLSDLKGARDAAERGVRLLGRRLRGLAGTTYTRTFLLGLAHNSGLLVAAEAYGCIPEDIERIVEGRTA